MAEFKETALNLNFKSRYCGFLDRPGSVVLADSLVAIRGWGAGPRPIRDIHFFIDKAYFGECLKRDSRPELHPNGYAAEHVFPFLFTEVSLASFHDREVELVAALNFVTGESFRLTKKIYVASSMEKALERLDARPLETVWSYINLMCDLSESGRPNDCQKIANAARVRFPKEKIVTDVVSGLPIAHGIIDHPIAVVMAGTQISVEGWLALPGDVKELKIAVSGLNGRLLSDGFFRRPDLCNPPLDRYQEEHKIGYRAADVVVPKELRGDHIISVAATVEGGATYHFNKNIHVAETASDAIRVLDDQSTQPVWNYIDLVAALVGSAREEEANVVLAHATKRFPADLNIKSLAYQLRNAVESVPTPDIALSGHLPKDVVGEFESLGFNCEFGFAQRAFDAEPLGLLRFSSTKLNALLTALRTDFAGVGAPEFTLLHPAWGNLEYALADSRYGFTSHTFIKPVSSKEEYEKIFERQCKRTIFLKDKLLSDLRNAEKIFLYYDYNRLEDDHINELFAALRRFGPNSLLCVRPAEKDHPGGIVNLMQSDLAIGYIEQFAKPEDIPGTTLASSWLEICRKAYGLLNRQDREREA